MTLDLSRRTLLKSSGALAASLATPAFAKAPKVNVQAPAVYRFTLGAFECTAISDGPLSLGAPKAEMFKGYTQERIDELFNANFLDKTKLEVDQNALVVNTGERLVLIDTGMGSRRMFGDKSGLLLGNLIVAGIDPAAVDAVILSHLHPDHCWGLTNTIGRPVFPNAQVYVSQADYDFWTDESKSTHPVIGGLIAPTRASLLPVRNRLVFIKEGQEVVPGITAIATPGHTVGHTSFVVSSQGKSIINIADLGHQYVLVTENPRAGFVFDTDPDQAVESRLKVFDLAASQRIPIIAYHFPWPGIGYLAKHGEGYRYVPAGIRTSL